MKDELPFDFVRPKKKYTKRDKLNPPRRPGRPPSHYTVNKADIKQYDFHSSGEEDFPAPLVSTGAPNPTPTWSRHTGWVFLSANRGVCVCDASVLLRLLLFYRTFIVVSIVHVYDELHHNYYSDVIIVAIGISQGLYHLISIYCAFFIVSLFVMLTTHL